MKLPDDKGLVLFDGYCHLCSGLVQHILRKDKSAHFLFTPLDSSVGKAWRDFFEIPDSVDSIIVIEQEQYFLYSDAVLKIARQIGGWYFVFRIGYLLPHSWRDTVYRMIARRRFSWFGRRNSCFLPDDSLQDRFL